MLVTIKLSLILCAHLFNILLFLHLTAQLIFMLLPDPLLLLLHVRGCRLHTHFRFDVLLEFLFQSRNGFINLRLDDVLVEDLVETVLVLVNLFYISSLIVVAPTNMIWGQTYNLFSLFVFKLLVCFFLLF